MASPAPPDLGRRLRLAVAGAAVLTTLTVTSAGASPPTPMESQAPATTRPGASPDQDPGTSRLPRGFLLDRGRFTPVTLPPELHHIAYLDLGPVDLNDRRQIVGSYDDVAADATRGFLLDRGRFTMIHVPGAKSTQAQGINNRGQIVGQSIRDPADPTTLRGFLRDARGRFTTISRPGAAATVAFGINNRGQIVGLAGNP